MADCSPMLYFAYGSNIPTPRLRARCKDAEAFGPAWLRDWQLAFSQYATIRPTEGAQVPGVVWRISQEDLRALDRYEGYPRYYRRVEVEVDTFAGERIAALAYVMNQDPDESPDDWYVELIREGYEEWGLPLPYLTEAISRCRQTRRRD